jgi:putative spermidine/putrescine transport system permease protein
VVTGIALLYFFQIVAVRDAFWNIVIGHIIITFPYVVRTVSVALARYDLALDDAAASLGARPPQVFWLVTLPLIRPGLFAGALFAFVMSFDDFTVTIFLTGTKTHTLPIAIYHYLEWNVDATVSAVSAVLVFLAVGVMLLVERLIGLDRFVGVRG